MLRLGGLAPRVLAVAAAAAAVVLPGASTAGATIGSSSCGGRFLLTCKEKQQVFSDTVDWLHAYVLDFELFETKTSLPLWNPSLRAFWRFEAASAAARGQFEFELGSEAVDANFEQLATAARLSRPSVRPHGVVTRKLARTLSALMRAEQQYVIWLGGMRTAMDRATFARYTESRADWVAWQETSAAGFATRAAAALGTVIKDQQAATKALAAKKLLFGVGVTDLKNSQHQVRRHGLASGLVGALRRLGLTTGKAGEIAKVQSGLLAIKPNAAFSFSLTGLLSATKVLTRERTLQSTLREFAGRIPFAGRPTS